MYSWPLNLLHNQGNNDFSQLFEKEGKEVILYAGRIDIWVNVDCNIFCLAIFTIILMPGQHSGLGVIRTLGRLVCTSNYTTELHP